MTADEFTINPQKLPTYAVAFANLQVLDYIMSNKSKNATQGARNEIEIIRPLNFKARHLMHLGKVNTFGKS